MKPVEYLTEHFLKKKELSKEMYIEAQVAPGRFVEHAQFDLQLRRTDGVISIDPIFSGLFSFGRESQWIKGWIDGDYFGITSFPDEATVKLSDGGLDVALFRVLGELVPPGGSLMLSYSLFARESIFHKETKLGLDRGYPPVVTPLGFLLFAAGCGLSFKDWYFAEGGREGPEKLQGYKPINSQIQKERGASMLRDLQRFCTNLEQENVFLNACRLRAEHVMRELRLIQEGGSLTPIRG